MDTGGAPDSWDQDVSDSKSEERIETVNQPMSALNIGGGSLNVNAAVFVPGQNVYAQAFVPSGPKVPVTAPVNNSAPVVEEQKTEEVQQMVTEDGTGDGDDGGGVKMEDKEEEMEKDWNDMEEDEEEEEEEEEEEDEEEEGAGDPEKAVARKKVKPQKVRKISEKKKAHLNVVFIGHVDAGKSTIGGHIMYLTGMVDKRTLEKYEREAKEKNRETWYLSWALDTNLEEREKGKTVEVGRAYFETEHKHFTILDAPGHKSFVPNMIGGASQADLAVLVISARRGEFETGFERGGQTREHAMLVKTAGVKHLVVVINKMDDPTVKWAESRYNECKEKLIPYLKRCGFNPKTDLFFIPVSGLTGMFLKDEAPESVCPWYRGPSLINYLDKLPELNRSVDKPLRMPVVDRYKDMGTILLGKVESGVITKTQNLLLMPNRTQVKIMTLWSYDEEAEEANPGENVKMKVSGVEEEDVAPGFVLCPASDPCHVGRVFDAQIVILEHKSIICAGYSAVLHIHTCAEEVTIQQLICIIDKKTGEKTQVKPRFIKQDQIGVARLVVNGGLICMETFNEFPQMGRFTLRDEGRTIAIGKVLKIKE